VASIHFGGNGVNRDLTIGTERISQRRTLVAISLYRGLEKRTMRTSSKSNSENPTVWRRLLDGWVSEADNG
jgi:hypothetical protein